VSENLIFEAPEIIVDEEFQSMLPTLDREIYSSLEENLLQNGCVYPLVLWDGILIDGHNRYEVCMKHEIPFTTVFKEFESRDEVFIWIIENQVARRNLNPTQLSYYRGRHYRSDKMIVTNKNGKNQFSEVEAQNGLQPKDTSTATRLAKKYKVSRNTIKRDAKVSEAIDAIGMTSPEAKRSILSGDTGITKKRLNELIRGIDEDIAETAASIENGTFEKKKPASPVPAVADGGDFGGGGSGGGGSGGSDFGGGGSNGIRLADGTLDGTALAQLDPLHAAAIRLSDDFISDVYRLARVNNNAGLKKEIRIFIESLEDVYGRIDRAVA